MLTYLVSLLLVEASVFEPTTETYILNIDNNTLMNIRLHNGSDVLNLSGRNLQAIKKDVFDNVPDVVSLDLSNNSLTFLPKFIFSNLSKLKNLSLADNRIWYLQNSFVGLENLQLLDISRNPINCLMRSSLYGLPKSIRILTNENKFEIFSTDMSRNDLSENEESAAITAQPKTVNKKREIKIINDTESQNAESSETPHKNTRLKLCKSDGIVTTLDFLRENEELAERCMPFNVSETHIDLHDQNITGFRHEWDRLYHLSIDSLDLSNNRIVEIEEEMLNNLPTSLTEVNFKYNQIRKIRSDVIENHHLKHLNFRNNLIEEIEDNAFAKTTLNSLHLFRNQLKNMDFVSTLPDTMTKLTASYNRITSISNNTFSKLFRLIYLDLQGNKIQKLQNDVFQNLKYLQMLILANNDITTIEPAAFKGLTSLKLLRLQHNFIRDLQANPFTKLTALRILDLVWNRIIKVPFTDLPRSLDILNLDFNEISALEKDSFVEVPRIKLTLSKNNIDRIERGAFNLPTLKVLFLDHNNLTTFESDSYEGLGNLHHLSLSDNQIFEIYKGSCKYLDSLYLLDISSNPFQKLESGAFYGLSTDAGRNVYIMGNNLKEVQVGLFDDI